MKNKIITRFAPSPTGFLHIGGARTALFNWLFARANGGEFLLRIEDTDQKRSTKPAIDAIIDGMNWLGLDHDGQVIYQSRNAGRHREVAQQLLNSGNAYYCYCSQDELAEMRAQAGDKGFRYNRKWRDSDATPPADIKPVIRFKAPLEGQTTIDDLVQGKVSVPNSDLDDLILLRADGTPTYMLSVVVDDYDMKISHAIRGDDHLTNAFRQQIIYDAMGWDAPKFAHIPLIHGTDGAKLSKRHGALGVDAYRDMGYLPEALRNYLLRLGWSHRDDEIISTKQAIEWFNLSSINKAPARIDFDKMANINAHYIKQSSNQDLLKLIDNLLDEVDLSDTKNPITQRITAGMDGLKERAKTINELAESCKFYIKRLDYTEKAETIVSQNKDIIDQIIPILQDVDGWKGDNIKSSIKSFADSEGLKLGKVLPPLRAAICGTMESPALFEILQIMGKDEVINRLVYI